MDMGEVGLFMMAASPSREYGDGCLEFGMLLNGRAALRRDQVIRGKLNSKAGKTQW